MRLAMVFLSIIRDRALLLMLGPVHLGRWKGVKIGSGCRIYTTSWGSEPFLIEIGDRVTITSSVKLLTHDGATWLVRDSKGRRYEKFQKIVIGDDVFIGMASIVMPGVTIGSRVIVGAGSIVTQDIPDNTVVAGNPARRISSFEDYKAKIISNEVNSSEVDPKLSRVDKVYEYIRLSAVKGG